MQTKRDVMLIAMVGLIMSGVLWAQHTLAAPASISYGVLHLQFPDGSIAEEPVDGSSAVLVRTDSGVTITIHTFDLPPGLAYTVWWVIYNNPEACEGTPHGDPCTLDDLFIEDVQATILNATGKVIGRNGRGNFAAHLAEGDTSGLSLPVAFPGDEVGLVDARKAQIQLGVRSHGQPIPGMVKEQISTFNGGCPPNTCQDEQITSVFVP